MASTASSSSTDIPRPQQDTTEHKDYATHYAGAQARPQHTNPDYGGNPLAHILTADYGDYRLPAFGGAFQPGLYKPPVFKFANPVPLGLAGFALTTFVLSMINLGTCGITGPNLVIAPALAYGGLVQLLAGMWDIALGNSESNSSYSVVRLLTSLSLRWHSFELLWRLLDRCSDSPYSRRL